ncbi:MAG TPA: hypothetical protein VLI39_08150 [Sedimentisphaerales bacterium]|nr:hypothetical protein [Sedimentisphaerales bacterium]
MKKVEPNEETPGSQDGGEMSKMSPEMPADANCSCANQMNDSQQMKKSSNGLGMFAELSIKGAESLRRHLAFDEAAYLSIAGHVWQDARAYVLCTSLDEVDKNAVHGLMIIPHLLEEGGPPWVRVDRIDRIFITQFLEQLQSRMRRDLEVLINLVLFSQTNEQPYYRHFLLIEELNNLLGANSDLEEFYGRRSANIDDSIARLTQRINHMEAEVDLGKCWYLRTEKPLGRTKDLRAGRLLNSTRNRLMRALALMSDHEKAMSHFSYRGYGQLSKAVHYVANRQDFLLDARQLEAIAAELGITCFCILERCRAVLNATGLPIPDQISRVLECCLPEDKVASFTVGAAVVGDIVLAHGDLAEVLELCDTRYNYRSYRVRYLAEKPKAEIQEDWFPASYIRRVYTKEQLKTGLMRLAEEGTVPPDICERMGGPPEAELQRIMRDSVIETWHAGLRDWMKHGQA